MLDLYNGREETGFSSHRVTGVSLFPLLSSLLLGQNLHTMVEPHCLPLRQGKGFDCYVEMGQGGSGAAF